MASTAAVLNILVSAQTGTAVSQLTLLDKKLKGTAATAGATSNTIGAKFGNKAKMAGGLVAVGVAAGVAAKELYKVGEELDAAYDKIRVGTGATGRELERLKKDFRAVARTVPDEFATTGTAIADLNTRLGLTGRPLRRMSRDMLNLARITETDLEGNIKSVARALVDWEVPAKRQTKTLNGLFRLGQKSGASVAEIADNMQKFGSPLRTLGFEVGEAAAMFANFERAGVNMQTMVPGLKLAIGNLVGPTDDLKKTLEGLGVSTNNPEQGLRQIMELLGGGSSLSGLQKMNLAMDVFGKRAGADMAEAIKQGRFNLKGFTDEFRNGSDTIGKTARDTNDAGQNIAIFWNKVKVAVAPAADVIFNAVSRFTKWLAGPNGSKAIKVFGTIVTTTFNTIVRPIRSFAKAAVDAFNWVRNTWQKVGRFFRGDVADTWADVRGRFSSGIAAIKGFVGGMWGKIKSGVNAVKRGMASVFRNTWDTVESIFVTGGNAVIDVINKIIDAINLIPGVDIEGIGSIGLSSGGKGPKWSQNGFQRGGDIRGGKPSGDSVPALLERGEYVLNRKAVQAVGKKTLDNINFNKAARFQTGGMVGMNIGGDVWDAAKGAAGGAASLAMKGPNFFINKLPDGATPEPFKGTGPWAVKQAAKWIKDKVNPFTSSGGGSWSGGSGQYPGVSGDTDFVPALGMALSAMSKAVGQNIFVQSGWRSYSEQAALYDAYLNGTGNLAAPPGSSNHEDGRAADITPGSEVFGSAAGRFGMGFTVPGESWHIELLRRGGLVGAIQKLMYGGSAEHQVVRNVGSHLLRSGWDFRSSAGILGNAWREGLWDPSTMEFTGADNGGLWGFTAPPKDMESLRQYAASKGKPWDDEIVQTNFMMRSGGAALRGAMNSLSTIPETTKYFMDKYEIPAPETAALDIRTAAAYDAAKILQRAGITKPGDGAEGMSQADKNRAAAKNRKKNRTAMLEKLWKRAGDSENPLAKKGGFSNYIKQFALYGDLDKDAKARIIETMRAAAGTLNPSGGISKLMSTGKWMQKNVDVIGDEEGNESFVKLLERIQEKVGARTDRKRSKKLSAIKRRGLEHPWLGDLLANDKYRAQYEELIGISEQNASAESGPGGSELTDAELQDQIKLNEFQLYLLKRRKGFVAKGLGYAQQMRDRFSDLLKQASKPGSPLAWKKSAFRGGLSNAKTTVGDLRGNLEELVGVTGKGGAIFDTKLRLRELGVSETLESSSQGVKDSEIAALLRESLGLANRQNAILSAQMPIFAQNMPKYHTGGVIPGRTEQPIMAMGGEGVFTPDQMKAMGGGSPTVVIEIAPGAGVDPNMIDARINGQLVKAVRKVRTGGPVAGRSYTTNG